MTVVSKDGETFHLRSCDILLPYLSLKPCGCEEVMPVFYKIETERRLVLSTASGALSQADVLAHQQKLLNDPDFDPTFSQIADFRQVTSFDLSADEIRFLAQRSIFSPHARRALIAPNDLGYGLARMFEMLRESQGDQATRVFRTLEEALDWVLTWDAKY